MANSCYNYINITGNKKELKSFKKIIKSNLKGTDIYLFLCEKFGKTETDGRWFDMDFNFEDEEVFIYGDSAWSPCLGLFTSISEKYPSFEINYQYEEGGSDFAGTAEISKGQCIDNCMSFWEGKAHNDYQTAFADAWEEINSLCELTEEEFLNSSLYIAFKKEEQKQLLEQFKQCA